MLAGPAGAVINGTVANNVYTGVARFSNINCSSVLVAPRVMLTSAHCLPEYALQCTDPVSTPLSVTFAGPNGGWPTTDSYGTRTIGVQALVQRPELFDLTPCMAEDKFDCGEDYDGLREAVDHSAELVVLYLAAEAPADAVPMPILVYPNVDVSHSAAEVATIQGLTAWVQGNQPLVTTVGYGVGSTAYMLAEDFAPRGRDYGVQRWLETSSEYYNFLGAATCDESNPVTSQPAVVVGPDDLDMTITGPPDAVAPGADFDAQQSHSGRGDSGGPVLLGEGPPSNGVSPDALANGGQYIAGTASIWVGEGNTFKTAFNPTWTFAASSFLMDALHDLDGDKYADPVDDDVDGDGCDNDVDQHPLDRFVQVGEVTNFNCQPSRSPRYGDESEHHDDDGLADCEDYDDDGDGIPDEDDPCPIDPGVICPSFGAVCPWNPELFDCGPAGCNETLVQIDDFINPDPTHAVTFPVVAVDYRVVVVAPPAGLSLEESAMILSGASGPVAPGELNHLQVLGSDGALRGSIAAYTADDVSVGSLEGERNILELHFGLDGRSIAIYGSYLPPNGPPRRFPFRGPS